MIPITTAQEARELTGFVVGGIPPFGFARPVRVVMDPDLDRFTTVWAAAGLSTTVFALPPATLRTLANAMVAPITETVPPADATVPAAPDALDSDALGTTSGGA